MTIASPRSPAAPRKRSRHVRLALVGATAFTLAACRDEDVPSAAFPTLDACLEAAAGPGTWVTEESCESGFGEALEAHVETAPRYDDQALCEAEHGGECLVEERPGGGGSVFLPLMAGYLLGNMLGGRGAALLRALLRRFRHAGRHSAQPCERQHHAVAQCLQCRTLDPHRRADDPRNRGPDGWLWRGADRHRGPGVRRLKAPNPRHIGTIRIECRN